MAKNKFFLTIFLALLAGCAVLIGCAGEAAGNGSERGDYKINPAPALEDTGYTLLRLGPGGFFNAYHEGWVYATGDKGPAYHGNYFIYRMRPDGTEKKEILDEFYLNQSVYHDGWLYYTGEIYMTIDGYNYDKFIEGAYSGALYRMRLDGSEKTQYTGVYGVSNYIIEGEWIYFQSGHDVYRVKISGDGLEKIADNCRGFIIAQGYIFLRYGGTTGGAAQYDTKIIRCDLDGSDKTILIKDEMISFSPLFVDSGYLYYALYFGDYYVADFNGYDADWETSRKGMALHRMKIDGTERQTVVPHSLEYALLQNIVLKDGYIYYSRLGKISLDSNDDTSYYRVRPDGTDHVLLCDKITNYNDGFEIIGSHIYYYVSPEDIAGLYRVPINGGSPEAVYTYTKYSEFYTGYFVADNKLYIVVR